MTYVVTTASKCRGWETNGGNKEQNQVRSSSAQPASQARQDQDIVNLRK